MAAISQQLKRELPAVMDASAAAAAPPATTTTPFAIVSTADAARDPLAAVAALHSARVSSLVLSSSSSPSAVAEDGDWGVTELFRAVAEDESLAKTIPTLTAENVDSIPQHALVRYRGMVQDTLDPEYYLGAYRSSESGGEGNERNWATTKFADVVPPAAAAAAAAAAGEAAGAFAPCCVHSAAAAAANPAPPPAAAVWERRPLYCVSVPGEAPAKEEGEKAPVAAAAAASAAAKRGRDGDGGGDDDMEAVAAAAGGEEEGRAAAASAADKKKKGSEQRKRENKASKAAEGGAGGADDKPQPPRPLPSRAGDAMVFFYPSPSRSSSPASSSSFSPKLNDIVEVWGVLSRVPELAAAHLDAAAENGSGNAGSSPPWPAASELAARPPTSSVPRLHALFSRRAERHPRLAAVARERGSSAAAAAADKSASPPSAPSPAASAARAAALARLRRALRGDPLAAEYLLLQLVSRVHLRTAGMALGTLALNITQCPKGTENGPKSPPASSSLSAFGSSVAEALSALAPRSVALPLSLGALNSSRLRPGRCPLSGRLAQAPLQLAPGTQVLLDETLLEPGTLTATGRDSVDALRGLLADRAVEYDFGYCRGSMPADAPVTILSSGKSGSVLRAHVDLAVPLQAGSDEGAGATGRSGLGEQLELEAAAAALFDTMRTSEFSFGEDDESVDDDAMEADGSAEEKKRGGAPKWLEEKLLEARRRGSVAASAASAAAAGSSAAAPPPAPTSEADLHLALTLARLYALSHGETVLRKEHWEGVERLEEARRARLAGAAAAAVPVPAGGN